MQKGFPNNIEYENLISTYDFVDTKNLKVLLSCIGLKENDFELGLTRVFLRPIKSSMLNMILQPSADEILKIKGEFEIKLADLVAQETAKDAIITM